MTEIRGTTTDITVIDNTIAARDAFGHGYGSGTILLNREHLDALEDGKVLALNDGEYTHFIQIVRSPYDTQPQPSILERSSPAMRLPAPLVRWLRRELGLLAADEALAAHARLIAGLRRDHETAVLVAARIEQTTTQDRTQALAHLESLARQLNANTKHLAYLDGMLQYVARTSPGIGNAITSYRRQIQAETVKFQKAQEAEVAATEAIPDAPLAPDTSPPLAVERHLTLVDAVNGKRAEAVKVVDAMLSLPHAAALPFVDAEIGEG